VSIFAVVTARAAVGQCGKDDVLPEAVSAGIDTANGIGVGGRNQRLQSADLAPAVGGAVRIAVQRDIVRQRALGIFDTAFQQVDDLLLRPSSGFPPGPR
jgi:hypothetical protein